MFRFYLIEVDLGERARGERGGGEGREKMGISRDSLHKRRETGGKQKPWRMKRKFELGRPAAQTKLSSNVTVKKIRVRGGNYKFRALRLDHGNFAWPSEGCTRKTRLLDVSYNASNNELVRTQTLVKNAIIQIDATPFKQFYLQHYGKGPATKKKGAKEEEETVEQKSKHVMRKLKLRNKDHKLDANLADQFATGRLYACISSRPGQCGRCDGYVLEGKELEFYLRKMQKKKVRMNEERRRKDMIMTMVIRMQHCKTFVYVRGIAWCRVACRHIHRRHIYTCRVYLSQSQPN